MQSKDSLKNHDVFFYVAKSVNPSEQCKRFYRKKLGDVELDGLSHGNKRFAAKIIGDEEYIIFRVTFFIITFIKLKRWLTIRFVNTERSFKRLKFTKETTDL